MHLDRYAVIGNPIAHSKSPRIHALYAAQTAQALSYEALLGPIGGFADCVDAFRAAGGRGMNVTVPFKLDAYAYATRLTARAEAAGALDRTCFSSDGPTDFEARVTQAKGRMVLVAQEIARQVGAILAEHALVQKKLAPAQKAFPQACADIAVQLSALLQKRFIVATPYERLQHFPRYLKAVALRLDKARNDPARDARLLADWQALARPWEREIGQMRKSGTVYPFLEEFRWLLEELRVALFAQELRTPSPVSVKRLQKMWEGRPR